MVAKQTKPKYVIVRTYSAGVHVGAPPDVGEAMTAPKPKPTPRPWSDGGCYSTIRGERRNIVIEGPRKKEVGQIRTAADAALCIAAPELLEACKLALEILEASKAPFAGGGFTVASDPFGPIRAAIAKAGGNEP